MREIIFRGKRVDNGEWIYGELIKTTIGWMITNYDSIDMNASLANSRYLGDIAAIKIIPETVGQFTGLTDKNGNKIFEGDIIIFPGITSGGNNKVCGEVKFSNERLRYEYGNDGVWYPLYNVTMPVPEIISNIHKSLTPNK